MTSNAPDNLHIAATSSSPEVDFRFSDHRLGLTGESYPENAAAFYAPVIEQTERYLASLATGEAVTVDVALSYFNSSSTKMLFGWFNVLNAAAGRGIGVRINWHRDVDDDTIQEFGSELHEEYAALDFHDMPSAS